MTAWQLAIGNLSKPYIRTPDSTCLYCGTMLPRSDTGRKKFYCNDLCRSRQQHLNKAAKRAGA